MGPGAGRRSRRRQVHLVVADRGDSQRPTALPLCHRRRIFGADESARRSHAGERRRVASTGGDSCGTSYRSCRARTAAGDGDRFHGDEGVQQIVKLVLTPTGDVTELGEAGVANVARALGEDALRGREADA